jgi:hypothetical protein
MAFDPPQARVVRGLLSMRVMLFFSGYFAARVSRMIAVSPSTPLRPNRPINLSLEFLFRERRCLAGAIGEVLVDALFGQRLFLGTGGFFGNPPVFPFFPRPAPAFVN